MKQLYILVALACMPFAAFSQDEEYTAEDSMAIMDHLIDSLESTLSYQTGTIKYQSYVGATLNVPKGFRYLGEEDAKRVVTELWGNPPSSADGVLGMLIPENMRVMDDDTWVFLVEYDGMGYVKDDDAADIDYDELLTEMKKDQVEGNKERESLGLGTVELIGWASKPYYDKQNHVLHWAKELNFNGAEMNTLNYNIRVLGRKGVIVLNAISNMDKLGVVKENIPLMLNAVKFDEGSKYENFDSSTDKVAAWTVGGLVAGKVLAKVGFWALLLKFGKFIIAGLIGLGALIWKLVSRKKQKKTQEQKNQAQPPATTL